MTSPLGQQAPVGYDDTPMQPNGKWRVHDGTRPHPAIITPPPASNVPAAAPSDAIVLLGTGSDLGAWQMANGSAATWMMKDGVLQTGKGMLSTKQQFTDLQVHHRVATPRSKGRRGAAKRVFLLGVSDPVPTLPEHHLPAAASALRKYPPLVMPLARRAVADLEIAFKSPRFSPDGAHRTAIVRAAQRCPRATRTPFWGHPPRSVLPTRRDGAGAPNLRPRNTIRSAISGRELKEYDGPRGGWRW